MERLPQHVELTQPVNLLLSAPQGFQLAMMLIPALTNVTDPAVLVHLVDLLFRKHLRLQGRTS
jgi:hypothetical protein